MARFRASSIEVEQMIHVTARGMLTANPKVRGAFIFAEIMCKALRTRLHKPALDRSRGVPRFGVSLRTLAQATQFQ
jgi:hypothetical protein